MGFYHAASVYITAKANSTQHLKYLPKNGSNNAMYLSVFSTDDTGRSISLNLSNSSKLKYEQYGDLSVCLYIWTGRCFKLVPKHILFSGKSDASMKRHINTGLTITNSICYSRTHRGEP